MAGSRRDVTTEHLRNIATELLLVNGAHAFSLNGVAQDAYVSIGAVYERWENKTWALADLLDTVVSPALAAMFNGIRGSSFDEAQRALFTSESAVRAQQLLVEMLFAARDDETLRESVSDVVGFTLDELRRPLGDGELAESLAMWQLSTLLGNALLLTGQADVCDFSAEVAQGLARATRYQHGGVLRPIAVDVHGSTPTVLDPAKLDATGERIRDATRSVLSESHDASTREVAAQAGVTTGALYRRFGSKSELINDVLIGELQSDRYAWADEIITTWQTASDSDALADVVSRQFNSSLANTAQVNMLLQITAQARSDDSVRKMVVGQIENVVRSRERMFAAIAASGVMERFTTPLGQAWLFQATPVGARLLRANDCGPTPEHITLAIRAIAAAFLAHDEN